jgi:hypothetical protein
LNQLGVHRFNEPKLGREALKSLAFMRKCRGVSDVFGVLFDHLIRPIQH